MSDLSAAGLSETEAKTYKMLLQQKSWLPSKLAVAVNETRTNIYKILDKLVDVELAERLETSKKLQYRAANPSRLLQLARNLRLQREQSEHELETNAQTLMSEYITVNEQAAVQFFQGKAEISRMFTGIANSKTPVTFLHSPSGINFYGFDFMSNLRILAADNGVPRHALTPDTPYIKKNYQSTDKKYLLTRTWIKERDYTAPVEWGVYDDKLYIISYGKEALGLTIESPQIAEAFLQIFKLLERHQKNMPGHSLLPLLARD